MKRVEALLQQFAPQRDESKHLLQSKWTACGVKNDDDIVVVAPLRTANTKARRGAFAKVPVEELLSFAMKGVLDKTKIDGKLIGDIVVGSVLGSNSQRANEARIASLLSGIPDSVPIHTINRQCSSGLQAIAHCAGSIKAGFYDIGLACGVESMSSAGMPVWQGAMNPKIFLNQQAKDVLLPMGITSENVAAQWKISRKEQDELAFASHKKAIDAIKSGKFKDEIIPVKVTLTDAKTGASKEVLVDTDEGPRADTSREGLAKLKPAFTPQGSTTAGNASQVSDGAAACLVMKRSKAKELGLPVAGVLRSFAVVGVPPSVMGIGPAFAIPAAVQQAGLSLDDIDVFEINEAFASQATMSIKHLKLNMDKVNPNGGAIALGHPLGQSGCRMTATLLNELKRRNAKYGIVSMCIGSGMGAAAVYEYEN